MAILLLAFSVLALLSTAAAIPTTTMFAKRWSFHGSGTYQSSRSWDSSGTWSRPSSWKGSWDVGQLFMWTGIVFGCMIGGFLLIAIVFWVGGLLDDWRLKRRGDSCAKRRLVNMTDTEKAILTRRIKAESVRKSRGSHQPQRIFPALPLNFSSPKSLTDYVAAGSERACHSGHIPVLQSIASNSSMDFGSTCRSAEQDTARDEAVTASTDPMTTSPAPAFNPVLWNYSANTDHLPSISTIIQNVRRQDSNEDISTTIDRLTKYQASSEASHDIDTIQKEDYLQTSSQEIVVGVAR